MNKELEVANVDEIDLMVNSGCNWRCHHCYICFNGERDPDDAFRLTTGLIERYGNKVFIAGGEILLNTGYLRSCQAAGMNYVLTNGLVLNKNPNIFSQLSEHGISELEISMHFGISETINSIPEPVVFDAVSSALRHGFKVRLNTTITSENYSNVLEMCRKAYNIGAKRIEFLRYVKSGRAKNIPNLSINQSQRKEFFDLVETAKREFSVDKLEIRKHGDFGPRPGSKGEYLSRTNNYCPAGKTVFAISPDNTVYGCPFLMQFPLGRVVGNKIVLDGELPSNREKCLTDCLL